MLNNILTHQWSCECIQTHKWHVFFYAKTFCLSFKSLSYNREASAWQWCFFFREMYSNLPCSRGFKCKYFMDPLWSFHTDCQGLQSLNSPEIKKRGTGESNHFSTSSLPDLLTDSRLRRKMKTPHPIWQNTYGMWRTHSGHTHCPPLECCIAAFYL